MSLIRYYIVILFVLLPVGDTFGALLPSSILTLLRGSIFLLSLKFVIGFSSNYRSITTFMLIYFSIRITLAIMMNIINLNDLTNIIRLLYFPVIFTLLFIFNRSLGLISNHKFTSTIALTNILIVVSILSGYILGTGGAILGRGELFNGQKGYLIGANEVGLMLLLSSYTTFNLIKRKINNPIILILFICLNIWIGFIVFTKSSLVFSLFSFLYLFYFIYNSIKTKLLRSAYLISITTLFIVKFSSSFSQLIQFGKKTFLNELIEGNIASFLFRGRQHYIEAILPQLYNAKDNYLIFLFGAGETTTRELSVQPLGLTKGQGTTFEMDFFDLFALYGVIGLFLFAMWIFLLLKNNWNSINSPTKWILFTVFTHSFLAGHVIFSPQVTTLISFLILSKEKPR